MHIHILGICGTFMGGLALLARELQNRVTGSDENVYPPMSTQLADVGINLFKGYENLAQLSPTPDYLVVGNVMRRGIPVIEAALNQNLPILSGPEWLARFVLHDKHVIAISGTHGKTTTTSMVAWILEYAGLNPGFLIGGVPNDFKVSARLGRGRYFVIEADEYDCAFFDKRSKFVHYRPKTLVINNLEFDHADIFPDLAAIQRQFHHLIRTVPGEGVIIYPKNDSAVIDVLKQGCWSQTTTFSSHEKEQTGWHAKQATADSSEFEVCFENQNYGKLQWSLLGEHNLQNALAAIPAALQVGVSPKISIQALSCFQGVKRRLELKGLKKGISIYDDFAHHPTAIQTTLAGLRAKIGNSANIIAVVDIRSNTMKLGHHQEALSASVNLANKVYFYHTPEIPWNVQTVWQNTQKPGGVYQDIPRLISALLTENPQAEYVVFMSNGGFGGIHALYLAALSD